MSKLYDTRFGYVIARINNNGQWHSCNYASKLPEARRLFKQETRKNPDHGEEIVIAAGDNSLIIERMGCQA